MAVMAPARSLLRVCCAALCLTSPLVGESPQPEQAAAVLEFYRTTSPETIDSGRAAELIQKYRGKEDKLLSKLQREAAELERLDIAWKFKWLRGTVWRWAPQGSDAAEATFGRDGRFLVADPRCIGGKCTWKTTKATVQVHVGELELDISSQCSSDAEINAERRCKEWRRGPHSQRRVRPRRRGWASSGAGHEDVGQCCEKQEGGAGKLLQWPEAAERSALVWTMRAARA